MDPIWADLHEVDVAVFLYLTFFKTLSYEPGAYRCGQTGCQQVLGIPLSHLLTIWITAVCYHVYLFYVDFEELNSRLHAGRTVARATRLLILFCVFIKHLAVYLTNGKYIFRAMHRLSWSYCYFFFIMTEARVRGKWVLAQSCHFYFSSFSCYQRYQENLNKALMMESSDQYSSADLVGARNPKHG